MSKLNRLDVLIVYSAKEAFSAGNMSASVASPFGPKAVNASCNPSYAYFLEMSQKLHLRAAFATSADIIGPGRCRNYWTFENKKWVKNSGICVAHQIFEKFAPSDPMTVTRRELLFSSPRVKPYNKPELYKTFYDKLKTYTKLAAFAIPTVAIDDRTQSGIRKAQIRLSRLIQASAHPNDFGLEVILKDRFGAGGNNIYKCDPSIPGSLQKIIDSNPKIRFVMQPFVKFGRGFTYQGKALATDIRFIFLNGRITQTYIRRAKENDFRCNEHQGGTSTYLTLSDLPKSLITEAKAIAGILGNEKPLYSLDFVISNRGNAYFLEGNTGPGLDWNADNPIHDYEAKKLIRLIVRELTERLHGDTGSGQVAAKTPTPYPLSKNIYLPIVV